MTWSSIKRKKCKCSDTCPKYPTTSFGGYYYAHAPEEIKLEQGLKAKKSYQKKYERAKVSNLSRKLHDADNDTKKELSASHKPEINSKSTLMAIADKVFGDWIKNRDKFIVFDEIQGKEVEAIKCPCCEQIFNLDAKDDAGEQIVNVLHFVKRGVYSLRYDERNCFAGCQYCNSAQHNNPSGRAYQKFKDFLVLRLGIGIVWKMEGQNRLVNKLSEGDLRDIISKYKPS